jgi:uncharacterized membrane protein YphA (DoxX/SURF4 family)
MHKQQPSTVLNVVLWITQILLAVTFIWAGTMKIFRPDELPWPWTKENPNLVMITGVLDLLAGFGLVLPAMLRIQPKLTIYAAYGIILLMVAASIFHIARGEGTQIGFNVFVLVCTVFIARGRQTKAPITAKGS